jgi:hypothetical protein
MQEEVMADRPNDPRVRALLGPDGPELTCEECFDKLDQYVELELAGADAEGAVPGMQSHLEGCPACREEHGSLLAFARSQSGEAQQT